MTPLENVFGDLALDATVQSVDTSVQSVDTSVQSVDSSVQAVDTSVQSVDTSIQSVDSTLAAGLAPLATDATVGAVRDRLPPALDGGDGGLKVHVQNTVASSALTDAQLRATPVPVSGTVTVTDGGGPLTVDGTVTVANPGLTDTQLRATPVPVSGTVAVSNTGLTDTELRATPVPVSGPLTDTQLRATPVPVSGSVVSSDSKVEDTPHVTGDTGTFMLGVRNDAAAALTSADGDYSPVSVDSAGRPKVVVDTSALPAGAATETTVASLDSKTPDTSGTYGYLTGVSSASLVLSGSKRVTKISALNSNLVTAASVNVNSMGAIPLPAGASIELKPDANLVDPTIVFTSTTSYVVEYVV